MINSAALLPSLSRSSGLSPRSAIGLNIIRRDSIAVDSLLKERLVLSKIRYGIERQEQERERRRNREADLEADSKQNYEVGDAPNNPRKRRRGIGGLLGTVFGGILSSLGGVAFQAAPAFLLARSNVLKGGVNFNRTIGATGGLLNTIKGQRGQFDTLKKVKLDPVKNIGRTITRFGNSLTFFVNSAIAGQVAGRALSATRTPAGVRSQVSTRFRARMSTSQIELERQLQNARLRENARARNRAMELERSQTVAEETMEEVMNSKRRRKMRQVEISGGVRAKKSAEEIMEEVMNPKKRRVRRTKQEEFSVPKGRVRAKKKFANIEIGVGGGFQEESRRGFNVPLREGGDPLGFMQEEQFLKNEGKLRKKRVNKNVERALKRGNITVIEGGEKVTYDINQMRGTYISKKPVFNIDGNDFDFSADLFRRTGNAANKDFRISTFFAEANEFRRGKFISPEDMEYMAKNILGKDDLADPFFRTQSNFYYKSLANMEIDRLKRKSKLSGTGRRGTDVKVTGRVGSKRFVKPDGSLLPKLDFFEPTPKSAKKIFKDIDKVKSQKVIPKKGIGKFLGNIGGSQFLKPVKEFIGQGVKNIPFIGDLIGILLDVFVFGEPIQRALFLAGGSALGGFLGGLAGSIGGPPGILIGGIIGGIAGDLLGGAFYDLLFRRGQRGSVGQRFGISATKASVKAGLFTGGFAGYGSYLLGEGGREFVLDADSTAALERRSPGFLMALNKARGAQAIGVIEDYASYDKTSTGKERMIPIPIPTPQNDSSSQNVMTTDSEVEGGTGGGFITFLSDHYRRA